MTNVLSWLSPRKAIVYLALHVAFVVALVLLGATLGQVVLFLGLLAVIFILAERFRKRKHVAVLRELFHQMGEPVPPETSLAGDSPIYTYLQFRGEAIFVCVSKAEGGVYLFKPHGFSVYIPASVLKGCTQFHGRYGNYLVLWEGQSEDRVLLTDPRRIEALL